MQKYSLIENVYFAYSAYWLSTRKQNKIREKEVFDDLSETKVIFVDSLTKFPPVKVAVIVSSQRKSQKCFDLKFLIIWKIETRAQDM
jgi:hypothetical protein